MSFVREHAKQREKQLVMAEVSDNEPEEIPPTPTDSREHLEQIPAREETPLGRRVRICYQCINKQPKKGREEIHPLH